MANQVETEIVHRPEVLSPIPPTELDRASLQNALDELVRDSDGLDALYANARAIEITDAVTYAQCGQYLSEARAVKPAPQNRLGNFYMLVRRVLTFLDTNANRVKNRIAEIEAVCLSKMKPYEQKELEETKKEQAAVNKVATKKGLPEVTVKPALPSVAGYRRSTTYHATFDTPADFDKLLRAWKNSKDKQTWEYLRKFLTFDEKKLNEEARELKDPALMMRKIPGVRSWQS